jgi:hypothetical protein
VYNTGFKLALDAYIAAVYPAGPDPIIKHLTLSIAFSVDIDNSFLLIYNTISRNGLQSYLKKWFIQFFLPHIPVFSFPKPMKTCNLSQKAQTIIRFFFQLLVSFQNFLLHLHPHFGM